MLTIAYEASPDIAADLAADMAADKKKPRGFAGLFADGGAGRRGRGNAVHQLDGGERSATDSLASPASPSWPEIARRNVFARPRVTCCSSFVTR